MGRALRALSLVVVAVSLLFSGTASADHSWKHWNHALGRAGGAPIYDQTGRPDLAQYAAEEWYKAANGMYVTWVNSGYQYATCQRVPGAIVVCKDWGVDWAAGTKGYADVGWDSNNHILDCVVHIHPFAYDRAVTPPSFENKVELHELGHCAGLGHTSTPGSIMQAKVYMDNFITQHDRDTMLAAYYFH